MVLLAVSQNLKTYTTYKLVGFVLRSTDSAAGDRALVLHFQPCQMEALDHLGQQENAINLST